MVKLYVYMLLGVLLPLACDMHPHEVGEKTRNDESEEIITDLLEAFEGPEWSTWKQFGKGCTGKCDKYTVKYKRKCQGGKGCPGGKWKFKECENLPPCAAWAEWQAKGKCSKKCGAGQQKYTRKCKKLKLGRKCKGAKTEFKPCNNGPCVTWGEWMDGDCSTTCGAGTMTQKRECQAGIGKCWGDIRQDVACNKGACAAWSDWKDGDCSVTCGVGTIKSTRECVGIGECAGEAEKSAVCNKGACAAWSDWKDCDCSVTCGVGTIKSTRECEGVGECAGEAEKSAVCNKGDCVAPCAAPSIPNGSSTCDRSTSISFGAPCTVSCDDGFEMKGSASITCGDSDNDGKGDFVLPTCQVPHGGMMYNGDVFVYLPEKRDVTRQQAIDACKELGDYHLAYVKSPETMQAIYDYALPLKPKDWGSNHMYLWLGGTVIPTSGLNNIYPVQWEDGTETHYAEEKYWNSRSRLGQHKWMSLILLDDSWNPAVIKPGPYFQNIWDYMASLSWPLCQKRRAA